MKRTPCSRIVIFACAILALAAVGYAGLYGCIQLNAHQKARAVYAAYPEAENEAESLILQIKSETISMEERRRAVWIAGRLRVKEALPVLKSCCTGETCQHDSQLCQRELTKAIRRISGSEGDKF